MNARAMLRPFRLEGLTSSLEPLLDWPKDPPKEHQLVPGDKSLAGLPVQVIGIIGEAQAGKDMIANYLYQTYAGVRLHAFSDLILEEANQILKPSGIRLNQRVKMRPEARRFLQDLGEARTEENPDYWSDRMSEKIYELLQSYDLVIVTGPRREREVSMLQNLGAPIWLVERPGNVYQTSHVSEERIKRLPFDDKIINYEDNRKRTYRNAEELLDACRNATT